MITRLPPIPLGVRVSLAVGAGIPAGPLTVTARNDDNRCLGAWNVTAGGPGAFFGAFEPGTLSIHWQIPGAAKAMVKEISFDEKRMFRFVLPLK